MAARIGPDIYVEAGVAGARACAVWEGMPVGFSFAPFNGVGLSANDRVPQFGELFIGILKKKDAGLGGYFVDLGHGQSGFLPLKDIQALTEGSRHVVAVRRPGMEGKEPILSLDLAKYGLIAPRTAVPENTRDAKAGWLPGQDFAYRSLFANPLMGSPKSIRALTPLAAQHLSVWADVFPNASTSVVDPAEVDQSISDLILDSLDPRVPLSFGASMIVQETAAGAMIDVDLAGANMSGGKQGDLNINAARRLFPELGRRGIAGRVVVDFVSMPSGQDRHRLADFLKKGVPFLPGYRAGDLRADGLFDCTMTKTDLSLLQKATQAGSDDAVIPARIVKADWALSSAIFQLEERMRQGSMLRFRLSLGRDVQATLNKDEDLAGRLRTSYGPRIAIEQSATLGPRAYAIDEI